MSNSLSGPRQKILVIRLSSLGDVILATAGLPALAARGEVHWIVAREFAPILEGNPHLARIWAFDRKTGLAGWVQLLGRLSREHYSEVYDLHRSMRSAIARWVLRALGLVRAHWVCVRKIRKSRWRSNGYFIFKGLWPGWLRPVPWVERYAQRLGAGALRPDLSYLAETGAKTLLGHANLPALPYVCVMPSAAWPGKRPSAGRILRSLKPKLSPLDSVWVLGLPGDAAGAEFARVAGGSGVHVHLALGRWDLPQTAHILKHAKFLIASDTGLAHLAEAVGCPVTMLMGPTRSDGGFGPWRATSHAVDTSLWCSPCSKDGTACFRRGTDQYLCQSSFDFDERDRAGPK